VSDGEVVTIHQRVQTGSGPAVEVARACASAARLRDPGALWRACGCCL